MHDLALVEDRERIARDLHDTVIQRLFATGMVLQSTLPLVSADPQAAIARISGAVDDLDTTIKDIRSAIFVVGAVAAGSESLRGRVLAVADEAAGPLGFTRASCSAGRSTRRSARPSAAICWPRCARR